MMKNAGMFLALVVVLGLIALSVACEVSVWRECRRDHSFIYCSRILSK